MKTKTLASSLPLLAGIVLGIVSLTMPFLLADHWITTGTGRYNVDNYLFFFWGKYYTVTGAQQILSQMVMYDFGDFPMYGMVVIVIAVITGIFSMFAGRGLLINVKGRAMKIGLDINPLWFQMTSIALLLLSYLYMKEAVRGLTFSLTVTNYEVVNGPAFDFLIGSIGAFVISAVLTTRKFLREENKREKKEKLKLSGSQST